MKFKKFATRFMAATLAGVLAIAPLTASAAELKTVEYNKEVTTNSGKLKLGYHETKDSTKTWWKTETYYTDWKDATEAEYKAVKDSDLKKMDDTGRSDWRDVDFKTYSEYKKNAPGDARTNGYTAWESTDKATYDKTADDLRTITYGDWKTVDKAAYDAETNPEQKQSSKSDWVQFADESNWASRYDDWAKYADDCRRANKAGDFFEVTQDEYTNFASKFPGRENDLYKYEDITYSQNGFDNWVYFEEQVICNTYLGSFHNPFFVLVGDAPNGCTAEGGTWDGNNDGFRQLNDSNGTSAQNIAEGVLSMLNSNGVPVITINGSGDLPSNVGVNKYNAHNNDGIHNAGTDGGNGFIDIVDDDFKIYYYGGTDDIYAESLYGILIAPHAKVNINGKWIGTIIADVVTGGGESAGWCYPINKGDVDRKYYICNPTLEVREDVYQIRTIDYKIRDNVYQVRDVVKKYWVRSLEKKIYYCEAAPYVPQTGDINLGYLIAVVLGVATLGVGLIVVSRKKEKDALR